MTNFYKETEAIVTRAACREAVKAMLAASGRICDAKKLNHANEYAELLQSKTPRIHEVRQQALEVITPSHPPCIIKLSDKGNVGFSFDPSASLMEGDTVSLDGGGTAIVLEVITAK